ncbi:uncharacterized protein BDZ99DRAFT_84831 [Mytilinidion resinicola]|uniref:Ankyrin n=1 Tax=Mytilinidion resinicola TaxID=574789 RepID=A0A6A6YD55_9PEZI|nr:uncharacterized protein BDZ99DRAFT_84831 [Mytilinidion resinicola]KAF2806752.1 hypothetical protein BDZ99DRAFT_84831 [Mytilinidion resinicola]
MSRFAECEKSVAKNEVLKAVCRTALGNLEATNMFSCLMADTYYDRQMLPRDWRDDEESRIDISQCSLLVAIAARYDEVQQSMLSSIADIDFETKYFGSPLHSACYAGHSDTVRLLLDQGADIHRVPRIMHEKRPSIYIAAASGRPDVVELLLEPRYDLDTSTRIFGWAAVAAVPKTLILQ